MKYFKRLMLKDANKKNDELYQFIKEGKFSYSAWYIGEGGNYHVFGGKPWKGLEEEFKAHQEFGYYVWYLVEQEVARLEDEHYQEQQKNIPLRIEKLEKEIKELRKMVDNR